MPRSQKNPILGKAMAFLALSLTPMAKAKGRITRKLLILKKAKRSYKQFRHYNYAYIGEYQFSPSNSPLIRYPPGVPAWRKGSKKRRPRKASVVLASLLCGGNDRDVAIVEGLPQAEEGRETEMYVEEWIEDGEEVDDEEEGGASVDGRAERFIERFYEEMRLQRQKSLVQLL